MIPSGCLLWPHQPRPRGYLVSHPHAQLVVQVLSSCMRHSAAAAQQWQQAAEGTRSFYATAAAAAAAAAASVAPQPVAGATSPQTGPCSTSSRCGQDQLNAASCKPAAHEGDPCGRLLGARLAHVAAAQLLAMGYECGMWDLLGCVSMAQQVCAGCACAQRFGLTGALVQLGCRVCVVWAVGWVLQPRHRGHDGKLKMHVELSMHDALSPREVQLQVCYRCCMMVQHPHCLSSFVPQAPRLI